MSFKLSLLLTMKMHFPTTYKGDHSGAQEIALVDIQYKSLIPVYYKQMLPVYYKLKLLRHTIKYVKEYFKQNGCLTSARPGIFQTIQS